MEECSKLRDLLAPELNLSRWRSVTSKLVVRHHTAAAISGRGDEDVEATTLVIVPRQVERAAVPTGEGHAPALRHAR